MPRLLGKWHLRYAISASDKASQAPLRPPPYFDSRTGAPHKDGIFLHEPPVCKRCSESASSITKLEQHAPKTQSADNRMKEGTTSGVKPDKHMCLKRSSSQQRDPAGGGSTTEDLMISRRFPSFKSSSPSSLSQSTPAGRHAQIARRVPAWMSLLPSNRNQHSSIYDPLSKKSSSVLDPPVCLPLHRMDKNGRSLYCASELSSSSQFLPRTPLGAGHYRIPVESFDSASSGRDDAAVSACRVQRCRSDSSSQGTSSVGSMHCPSTQMGPAIPLRRLRSYVVPKRQNHPKPYEFGCRQSSMMEASGLQSKTPAERRSTRTKELSSFFSMRYDKWTPPTRAAKVSDTGDQNTVKATLKSDFQADGMTAGPGRPFCL